MNCIKEKKSIQKLASSALKSNENLIIRINAKLIDISDIFMWDCHQNISSNEQKHYIRPKIKSLHILYLYRRLAAAALFAILWAVVSKNSNLFVPEALNCRHH